MPLTLGLKTCRHTGQLCRLLASILSMPLAFCFHAGHHAGQLRRLLVGCTLGRLRCQHQALPHLGQLNRLRLMVCLQLRKLALQQRHLCCRHIHHSLQVFHSL